MTTGGDIRYGDTERVGDVCQSGASQSASFLSFHLSGGPSECLPEYGKIASGTPCLGTGGILTGVGGSS